MTYKIFNSSKDKLRWKNFFLIFFIALIALITGIVFEILFLRILGIVGLFLIWVPHFYFKEEFAGTINFNETGIIPSKEGLDELHLQYADIQNIAMNYVGYYNEIQTVGTKIYYATGRNIVYITTKDEEYEIVF